MDLSWMRRGSLDRLILQRDRTEIVKDPSSDIKFNLFPGKPLHSLFEFQPIAERLYLDRERTRGQFPVPKVEEDIPIPTKYVYEHRTFHYGLNRTRSPSSSESSELSANSTTLMHAAAPGSIVFPFTEGKFSRSYNRFSRQEEDMLVEGVALYGEGQWSKIANHFFFKARSPVDLKDKWRNLKKRCSKSPIVRLGTMRKGSASKKPGPTPRRRSC